jgi:hypothetical protein
MKMHNSLVAFNTMTLLKISTIGLESKCSLLRTRSPAYNMNICSYCRINRGDGGAEPGNTDSRTPPYLKRTTEHYQCGTNYVLQTKRDSCHKTFLIALFLGSTSQGSLNTSLGQNCYLSLICSNPRVCYVSLQCVTLHGD